MFVSTVPVKKITEVYRLSGDNFERATTCLLSGPTLASILKMINERFDEMPRRKVFVDLSDAWSDLVSYYKGTSVDFHSQLRITLDGQPAIDTGGVRRQVYTTAFNAFANNERIRLFEGPINQLRPVCTAEARSSGLLKLLGSMIAHSICQDGVGFPFFSRTCYWYIVGGEDKALQFACIEDLPADSAFLLSQVHF